MVRSKSTESSRRPTRAGFSRPRQETLDTAQLDKLSEVAASVAESLGFEIVKLTYSSGAHRSILRVSLDSDTGITLGDCARFSSNFGDTLESTGFIAEAYSLEVSSPGATRPFSELKHYVRNLNQVVEVQLKEPIGERSQFKGLLIDANEESIRLRPEGVRAGEIDEVVIPMTLVRKANRSIQI